MAIKVTPELAEICGIHVGDGYLRNDGKRIELDISGSIEEKEYYDNHINPLFKEVFGIKLKNRFFPSRRTYGFVLRDPKIIEFLHELGFPYGKKSTIIRVPKLILDNKNKLIHSRFLRGLFDTDGNLNFKRGYGKYVEFKKRYPYYPRMNLVSVSKKLIEEIGFLLKNLGFSFFVHTYQKPKRPNENIEYRVILNGIPQLDRWMTNVGIKNITKLSRYLIWKKYGFCPTNISFEKRKKILTGKINPFNI